MTCLNSRVTDRGTPGRGLIGQDHGTDNDASSASPGCLAIAGAQASYVRLMSGERPRVTQVTYAGSNRAAASHAIALPSGSNYSRCRSH